MLGFTITAIIEIATDVPLRCPLILQWLWLALTRWRHMFCAISVRSYAFSVHRQSGDALPARSCGFSSPTGNKTSARSDAGNSRTNRATVTSVARSRVSEQHCIQILHRGAWWPACSDEDRSDDRATVEIATALPRTGAKIAGTTPLMPIELTDLLRMGHIRVQ